MDQLFDQKEVQEGFEFDSGMHEGRDRYSDIVTYKKSRVKLVEGAGKAACDDYINACYLNSPFSLYAT